MSPPELATAMAADLRSLVDLAGDAAVDDLLRRGLDWVGRLAPYDLATIFTLQDQSLIVRAARGNLAGKVREHSLDLADFPSLAVQPASEEGPREGPIGLADQT